MYVCTHDYPYTSVVLAMCTDFPSQSAKSVSQALNQVVNCLPGQREIEAALNTIREAMKEAEVILSPYLFICILYCTYSV